MKKLFLFLGIVLTLAIVASLNFNGLSHSKEYFDLNDAIEISVAQAEDVGDGKKCDEEGGLGLPFWDRVCDDCCIHFNSFYDRDHTCEGC